MIFFLLFALRFTIGLTKANNTQLLKDHQYPVESSQTTPGLNQICSSIIHVDISQGQYILDPYGLSCELN